VNWKRVRGYSSHFAIRFVIVAGFLMCPDSKAWGNYIYLLHYWFWFTTVLIIVAIFAETLAITSNNHNSDHVKYLKELNISFSSWMHRFEVWTLDIPSLIFVGVMMGDWSLFIPMLLTQLGEGLFKAMVVEAWKRLPENVRNPGAKGCNDNEIKQAYMGLVAKIKKEMDDKKAKEAAEKAKEEATAAALADKIIGDA
jgi:hypothetical protein